MTDQSFENRVQQRLQELHDQQRFRAANVVQLLANGRCEINGQALINFGGNDYLGLAHEVGRVFREEAVTQVGATASALVAGRSHLHHDLENALAAFEATEAALLFPTGYAANLGVLTGLVEDGDAVFCDRDNHASIIDAARASAGKMLVYRRDRLAALQQSLAKRRHEFRNVFLVTDGVFSMDGTVAPLAELCDLAEQFDARVIVDEAHGTGVLGTHGRGACDLACGNDGASVEDRVLLRVGTMSKAMGGLGGFAVSTQPVIDLLRNTARTQFYSTALPPAMCAAMLESLRIITSEPERRERLQQLTRLAHIEIVARGLSTVPSGVTPIVPVIVPGEAAVMKASKALREAGYFVPAIRTPTVRAGAERLRLSFGVHHSEEAVTNVLAAISDLTSGSAAGF